MHANLHITTIRRSTGRSAVAASAYRSAVACAAYRAGEQMQDDRYNKTHDYSRKENVLHSEIIAPEGAPEWMTNRQSLWNGVEAGEKRKDAQLAKEIILTLPRNLDLDQQKEVVRGFARESIVDKYNLVADYAIHSPDASDGGKNPHAHIMFTLRPVEGDGFGKKLTGYLDGGLDGKQALQDWRFDYEKHLNKASENADSEIRFDLRSLREKGIDREPQPKIGPKVNYLEKRGYQTEWGKEVRRAAHRNHARDGYRRHTASYQLIGGGSSHHAYVVESIRADVAQKYYEVMYGEDRGVAEWQRE
jgi:ATP-dependent exoDNAse (exonuclease V) alpha subunit